MLKLFLLAIGIFFVEVTAVFSFVASISVVNLNIFIVLKDIILCVKDNKFENANNFFVQQVWGCNMEVLVVCSWGHSMYYAFEFIVEVNSKVYILLI